MAKIELSSFLLGSSKDNFIVFQNNSYERPYVTFYIVTGQNPVGQITIKDALDDDGYNKVLLYSPSQTITDASFKTIPDNKTATTFSLLECIKKNQIFYDVTLVQDIPNVGIVIKAYIDSSTKYSITAGGYINVGGNFSSYNPKEPNKFVLLENTSDNQITLEKYTYSDEVSFNVTSPFEHLSFKDPFQVKLLAYRVDNNTIVPESVANSSVYVFPTTLTKFDDTNIGDYNYTTSGQMVSFLTNRMVRSYNYGEKCGLSVLTNKSGIGLIKRYYTVSGKYLYTDTEVLYTETHPYRKDFYFELDIDGVEAGTNKQVGYVEVFANEGGTQITNAIRYNVEAKCNQNNEIFFVNELGGIDSFNFLGERVYETKIDDQTTYFRNPVRPWQTIKELEMVSQKKNKVEHTLKTTIIGEETARWLNELSKSKYAFLFVNENGIRYERIIVKDMDIEISDRENTYEVELTYQDGDNNISI